MIDFLTSLPAWAWWAAAAAVWYPLAGFVLRRLRGPLEDEVDIGFWLFSPVIAAALVAIGLVSVVLWLLSGGLVPPFWKW